MPAATGLIFFFNCNPQYDDYCAPILHLGGLLVDVVKTDSEGHARRYIEELETLPETILCAGGDGTLSEVVTGEYFHSLRSICSTLTNSFELCRPFASIECE